MLVRGPTAALCILLCALAAPAHADSPTMQGAPSEPSFFHNHPQAETAVDDSVELVQEMFIVGPINHYGIELNGREWCEPAHVGVQPNVDWGCISSMIHGGP